MAFLCLLLPQVCSIYPSVTLQTNVMPQKRRKEEGEDLKFEITAFQQQTLQTLGDELLVTAEHLHLLRVDSTAFKRMLLQSEVGSLERDDVVDWHATIEEMGVGEYLENYTVKFPVVSMWKEIVADVGKMHQESDC